MAPVLTAVAIQQFENDQPWTDWILWLGIAIALVILCRLLLYYAEHNAQESTIYISELERKDQELLTFLFIYLLPFIRSTNFSFDDEWLTSAYVLAVIIIAITHTGAFHFNPVMHLVFGYRFYSVRNREGVSNLLISKSVIRRHPVEVQTVRLDWNIYLQKG